MKLLSIPNIPNYQVDVENGVVYMMRYGRLKEVKTRTKYKSFTIKVNRRTIGTTLYRMMYCAINQIELTKIPSGICISMENGKLVVLDRSMVIKKTNDARKRNTERMERIKANMKLIERYYDGDVQPILDYLHRVEKSIVFHFIDVYGLCQERAEIIVANAVNKYLDKLKDGVSSFAIRASVMRYAKGENAKIIRQCEFNDNINHGEL
jgi:hypothetical protein